MKIILTILVFVPLLCLGQSKGDNTIKVSGVNFLEVANKFLNAGYIFEKVDSNLQTIKTEFKSGAGKTKWMKIRMYARIKDSSVIISGDWYNSLLIGSKIINQEQTIENSTFRIENRSGNPGACFEEMKQFALSFHKSLEYLCQ